MQSATQSTLSSLVEAHISALIQESATVNRHSRRGGLISATTAADDTNNNNSKSNGVSNKRRRLIHHDDVNMALQWRGSEKLYVSGVSVPCVDNNNAPSSPEKTAAGGGRAKNALTQLLRNTTTNNTTTTTTTTTVASLLKSSTIPRVDLNAYLHSELSIRPPSELGMTLHWLAVDGVAPMIPMNEVWNTKINTNINNNGGGGSSSVGGLDPLAPVLELDDENNDDESSMLSKQHKQNDTSIRIRELQQRLLSEELQLYFSRVTSTIENYSSSNNNLNNNNNHNNDLSELYAVLNGIRTDTGIQELVPFLSRYVASGLMTKSNLQNTQYCMCLMKIFDAMLDNTNLHLDLHLHQMLSPVGTCVVARKLSSRGGSGIGSGRKYYEEEDHWSLRELAARCLVKACDMYGVQYTTMKPRIMKLLTQQALRLDRPLVTQYGGIVGISLFGPRAIDAFLLPVAKKYWEYWDKELQTLVNNSSSSGKKRDVWREYELQMCQQALLDAVSMFMRGVNPGEQAKRVDIESFADVFGERLIPMQPELTEYVSAIL